MTDSRIIQSSTASGVFPYQEFSPPEFNNVSDQNLSSFNIASGLGLTAGLLFLGPFIPRSATLPLMIGFGILPLLLPSRALANPKPSSCYQKKEKKEQYTTEIAITAIVLGSLLTVLGHKITFPKITRLINRLLKDGIGLPERFRLNDTTITRFLFGTAYQKPSPPKNLWDKGIMFLTDRPFHLLGRVGFSVAAAEFGLRSFMGYEHHLSVGGGTFSMFFWNRIGIQYWGLDRAGASLMFVIDRFADALTQVQSGENWKDVNWYYVANHYGAVTLFGTFRARAVRDFLFRRLDQRLVSSMQFTSGESSSPTLVYRRGIGSRVTLKVERWRQGKDAVRAISLEEDDLVAALLKSSNWNNRVWLNEQGQLADKTGRLLGTEISELQRRGLARLLGKDQFATLFASEAGTKIESIGAMKFLQVKVKGDANTLGFLAYWTLQEPLMSPPLVALPAALLAGEDIEKSFKSAWYKAFLQFPRQYFKLHLGIDTTSAAFVDRIMKYTTEPYLAKFIPLFASKGLWRKHYDQAICSSSLDEFVDYHIAPQVWEGGLFRYNENILMTNDNIPLTLFDLPKRNRFAGWSPYSPTGISFRLLAKYYANPEAMGIEEREAVSHFIEEIIEEAKRRRNLDRVELLEYQDETVIQLASALSVAAYYAHRKQSEYFADLIRRNKDWFNRYDDLFFEKEEKHLEMVERYVDAL